MLKQSPFGMEPKGESRIAVGGPPIAAPIKKGAVIAEIRRKTFPRFLWMVALSGQGKARCRPAEKLQSAYYCQSTPIRPKINAHPRRTCRSLEMKIITF